MKKFTFKKTPKDRLDILLNLIYKCKAKNGVMDVDKYEILFDCIEEVILKYSNYLKDHKYIMTFMWKKMNCCKARDQEELRRIYSNELDMVEIFQGLDFSGGCSDD